MKDELHQTRIELKMRRIAQSKLECRCDVVTARVAGLAAQAQGKTSADEVDPKTT